MPLGKLIISRQEDRGKMRDLFTPHFRWTTLLLWFIWFSNAFSYYGLVLLTTELFQAGDVCSSEYGSPFTGHHACSQHATDTHSHPRFCPHRAWPCTDPTDFTPQTPGRKCVQNLSLEDLGCGFHGAVQRLRPVMANLVSSACQHFEKP
uniref:SV2 related protein n=1 Tax=Myotis myotis TaxID=51298 RepID=A0A7J7S3B1_MYOMY|nr:SV2 related protein [Myotis myotis]